LETSAFEKIIQNSKASIYRICKIYAVKPLEPQDLFQEVVLQVWKSYASFKGKSGVKTWIYRIALNVCMSSKLKLEKHRHQSMKLTSIRIEAEQINEEEKARFDALRACINELKEGERSLVVLYLEELSYAEISEILGITENHVAVKMKRIRKKLFGCIIKKIENE